MPKSKQNPLLPPLARITTGAELREYRKLLGMSIAEMAAWLGVTENTFRGWEIGRKDRQGLNIYFLTANKPDFDAKSRPEF